MRKLAKLLVLTLTLSTLLFSACGKNGGNGNNTEPPITPIVIGGVNAATNIERASDVVDNFLTQYWRTGANNNHYVFENRNGDSVGGSAVNQKGYLWTYFCMTGMQYQFVRLDPTNAEAKATFKQMIDGLIYYRSSDSTSGTSIGTISVAGDALMSKYNSGRGVSPNNGGGDIFFDDNIWVARNYLFAYEIFGDEQYLKEAINVAKFVRSGWNSELGGVPWNERGKTTSGSAQDRERGLSANACGIIVNAWLARIIDEMDSVPAYMEERSVYVEWATKFYNFCKTTQDTDTKIYYNGWHTNVKDGKLVSGTVNKDLYSYNPGSMIIANLYMYKVTGEQEYYTDAKESATAADNIFRTIDLGSKLDYYWGDTWFAAILHESYIELMEYDKEFIADSIEAFNKAIEFAYDNRDSITKLMGEPMIAVYNGSARHKWGITQAGMAEIQVLTALATSYYEAD